MKEKLYKKISSLISAIENCKKANNAEWLVRHKKSLSDLQNRYLEFNAKIDLEESTPEKLIFYFSYHHMNDVGYYIGRYDYRIVGKPSLQSELNIRVIGKDKNQIKDYFYDVFFTSLIQEIEDKDYLLLESEESK